MKLSAAERAAVDAAERQVREGRPLSSQQAAGLRILQRHVIGRGDVRDHDEHERVQALLDGAREATSDA